MTRRNLWMTPLALLAGWRMPKRVRWPGEGRRKPMMDGFAGMPTVEDEDRLEALLDTHQ